MSRPRRRNRSISKVDVAEKARNDIWLNKLIGMGVNGKDNRLGGFAFYRGPMTQTEAEELYASDPIAARIVDLLPDDATRAWIRITSPEEKTKTITDQDDRLQIQQKFREADSVARQFGGSAIFLNVDEGLGEDETKGGQHLALPLDLKKVKNLKSLQVFDRWELWATSTDVNNDINSSNFGKPEWYQLRTVVGGGQHFVRIHHTRLLIFQGRQLPRRLFEANQYWSDSWLNSLQEPLRDMSTAHNATASIVIDFRTVVYKLKDLAKKIAAGKGEDVKKRIALLNEIKSVFGSYIMDKDSEEMKFESPALSGLKDLVDKIEGRLQKSVDIPHYKLFNESPSGLGADGRSEERTWNQHVQNHQTNVLQVQLDKYYKVLLAGDDTDLSDAEVEEFDYKWEALFILDEMQSAEVNLKNAQSAQLDIGNGSLAPTEVRSARFPNLSEVPEGGEILSLEKAAEIEVEMERLRNEAEAAKAELAKGANPTDPDDPDAGGGNGND